MAATEGDSTKTCAMCGTDCTGAPRAKDKRGRYYCAACYAKATAKARARKAAAASTEAKAAPATGRGLLDDPGLLRTLAKVERISSAIDIEYVNCTNCKKPMRADTVLCLTCGHNRETGQTAALLENVAAPPVPAGLVGGGAATQLIRSPLFIGAAQLAFVLLLFLGGIMSEGFVPVYAVLILIYGLGVGLWTLFTAFQESAMSGILCLLCGFYSIYFVYAKSGNSYLIASYSVAIIAQLLLFALPGGMEFAG